MRVSRSGKYGSQASSPRSDRQMAPHPSLMGQDSDEDEEEDEDEEDEEDEEEENIEAEIHLNDMKAQNDTVDTSGKSGQDLIVSYSAFQAEAQAAAAALDRSQGMFYYLLSKDYITK